MTTGFTDVDDSQLEPFRLPLTARRPPALTANRAPRLVGVGVAADLRDGATRNTWYAPSPGVRLLASCSALLAAGMTAAIAIAIGVISRERRLQEDAAIGIVLIRLTS